MKKAKKRTPRKRARNVYDVVAADPAFLAMALKSVRGDFHRKLAQAMNDEAQRAMADAKLRLPGLQMSYDTAEVDVLLQAIAEPQEWPRERIRYIADRVKRSLMVTRLPDKEATQIHKQVVALEHQVHELSRSLKRAREALEVRPRMR
jgi:hypothetical protein